MDDWSRDFQRLVIGGACALVGGVYLMSSSNPHKRQGPRYGPRPGSTVSSVIVKSAALVDSVEFIYRRVEVDPFSPYHPYPAPPTTLASFHFHVHPQTESFQSG